VGEGGGGGGEELRGGGGGGGGGGGAMAPLDNINKAERGLIMQFSFCFSVASLLENFLPTPLKK